MGLIEQLALQKQTIVHKWFARVIASYPAETARFLSSQKDPFANPVGQTTRQSLTTLIELLTSTPDAAAMRAALDPVMRIRAVQSFSPAQAMGFVFELKAIIRQELPAKELTLAQWATMEQRIDQMALEAFDLYMQCREKIYELKANEMKDRTYKAFAKAGLIKEPADE
ncbi:MAG: RsbRD N-terminal domain-containing protein [Desulfobacteraceae bacterium]|nr:RsbRD N-terminal domain-containing protein [Desulfobacteraceae bacterium]